MSGASPERRHDPEMMRVLQSIQSSCQETEKASKSAEALSKETHTGINMLHLKLFGTPEVDEGKETEHGRIPRLEAKVKKDDDRINRLERFAILIMGGSFVVGFLLKVAKII